MEEKKEEKGISLGDILQSLKKNWIILLSITLVVFLIGVIYSYGFVKNKYYADGSISVEYKETSETGTIDVNTTQSLRYVNTVGDFLTSEIVLTNVAEALSSEYKLTVTGLRGVISATYSTDAMIITIRVTTTDGEKSQAIVRAVVDEICKYSVDSTSSYDHFYCNISKRDYALNYYNGGPNRLLYLIIAGLAGVVLACAVIFVKEFASNKFKTKEEIEALGLPISGIKYDDKDAKDKIIEPSIVNFETYNRMLSNIKLANVDNPIKSIMVTSTDQGELKTTVCANLAFTARSNNKNVLIIDLDIRKPRLDKLFKVEKENGLSEYLLDDLSLDNVIKKTEFGVDIITAGKKIDNPILVLESDKLKNLINDLKDKYDLIVIDTPPLLVCSDAEQIGKICDGALFNVAINQAKKKDIKDSINALVTRDVNVIGLNITKLKVSKKNKYYNYHD